jgi:hypothetical protein
MGMKQIIDVINRLEADGVIGRYAIAGAVASYNFVEENAVDPRRKQPRKRQSTSRRAE